MFRGVIKTMPGYAGGTTKNPTYDDVCSHDTGHAEVLEITYDPDVIPINTLLEIFFAMHDPTEHNRQGADVGSQYRSIILYTTEEQKKAAESFIKIAQRDFSKPIATEIRKLDKFYDAESYHRDYFERNPIQPYCIFVVGPKVKKIREKFKDLLK